MCPSESPRDYKTVAIFEDGQYYVDKGECFTNKTPSILEATDLTDIFIPDHPNRLHNDPYTVKRAYFSFKFGPAKVKKTIMRGGVTKKIPYWC